MEYDGKGGFTSKDGEAAVEKIGLGSAATFFIAMLYLILHFLLRLFLDAVHSTSRLAIGRGCVGRRHTAQHLGPGGESRTTHLHTSY